MNIKELLGEINPLYLSDLNNENHHSIFINEERYKILILRGLGISEGGLAYESKGMVIDNEYQVYQFDRDEDALEKSSVNFSKLYELVSPIFKRNEQIIGHYISEIDKLEDTLFERKSTRIFMDIWFDIKKDLTRIDRYFDRSLGVVNSFQKAFSQTDDFQNVEFLDLISGVGHTQQSLKNQISRLDALYDYYVSIKNEKLNNDLYTLTILSAIFLPLNLIVGFFGMNTENLFFKDNPFGTKYVLFIVLGSFILSAFGLPLIRFINQRILKMFLGRYKIYNQISGRIDQLFKID